MERTKMIKTNNFFRHIVMFSTGVHFINIILYHFSITNLIIILLAGIVTASPYIFQCSLSEQFSLLRS